MSGTQPTKIHRRGYHNKADGKKSLPAALENLNMSRMKTSLRSIIWRVTAVIIGAAGGGSATSAPLSHGLDLAGIDHAVKPGDDFFAYANGAWLKNTEIPADRSSYGIGAMLVEITNKRTAALIQELDAHRAAVSPEARQIGDYYAAFMDEAAIEKLGLRPLEPQLARIAAIADRKALAEILGAELLADVDALNSTNFYTDRIFGLWVAQDLNDPKSYAAFLLQGGLGMPDREYYLDSSARMAAIRDKYQAHIARVLALAHIADADAKSKRIFELEHRIAAAHWPRVDSEDVLKANNHWTQRDFQTRAPGLDWQAYFKGARLDRQTDFTVWQPSAISGISALTASQSLTTWKDYLTFHAIEHAANYLPRAYVNEYFDFHGKELAGTPALRERWKRGVDATSDALGEAVGKLYVERYFSPAEKSRVEAMVRNLVLAFGARIDKLEWMAPQTKTRAKEKLATLKVGVGYPDKWRDYSGLKVSRGDALGNAERAEQFEYRRNLAKLGAPIDRSEWVMTPQTVNAVNLPVMNALNFPAAILQPPEFDPAQPVVMDYGATGAVVGHEISHSFDDEGALFDASGRLNNWWTKEDFAHFKASSARLAEQYNAYHPFPDLAVNGKQTLSENIADVAGLAVAYDAYQLSLHGKPAPAAQGFTSDQQFFLSFAQSWRQKIREPALRQRIVTDGHAPDEYRADTVRNLDGWYAAFDVKPGQKLYLAPQARVQVW
jgi:putative endopeptidase